MLTHQRLLQVMEYDSETGEFTWLVNLRGPVKMGMRVGNAMKGGHRQTCIDGEKFLLHRLAWFYMMGVWPSKDIDHINRNGGDNRWCNLREATVSQNLANQKLSVRNKSGYKGVFYNALNGRYLASIGFQGRVKNLGHHDTAEEAAEAYAKAAEELFGEFAHPARAVA